MIELNLPNIDCNIRKKAANVEIFDIIRKKYIVLTPEEWVRQHFIHYLIHHLNYPKSLFKVESGLNYNRLSKRSDILVYNNAMEPELLVECKAYNVKINQKGFDQLSIYNSKIKARYLVLTNGLSHYCCTRSSDDTRYDFLNEVPAYK
ncbi:type I restriction enzyme HsdR N-terminal domain-containing protein [Fulvivirga sp. RKSG066]|uniref:type I restriction enzyme HsdR N-terminal domain-containing protein n=1 Tax=Fulvivirga aurantia TaxID=2529383 RepID=UPI0012BBCF22|nr:type I restriction enzyme HsdR N-terminal domain-containing protein [Fulvivirga aurantia]MTI20922.1 type I restriction enzyme HsdR N-terminal domain-containing protein [Fulvivirga aurantia]